MTFILETNSMKNQWESLNYKDVYKNAWIEVTEHQVIDQNGNKGIYGKVHFRKKTVAILATNELGQILLVGQHRFPINQYSWEIPMGAREKGESAKEAAERELKEETGWSGYNWQHILTIHPSNGVTDEEVEIFSCQLNSFGSSKPDPTEKLSVQLFEKTNIIEMVKSKTITDATSICAVLFLN